MTSCLSVGFVLIVLACRGGSDDDGPLNAAAILGERSYNCETVESWPVAVVQPPFSVCRSTSRDTLFLKVTDANGQLVSVARRWDSVGDDRLYQQLLSSLKANYGMGTEYPPPEVDRTDRQLTVWHFDGHHLALRWEPSEDRVYEVWALGPYEEPLSSSPP